MEQAFANRRRFPRYRTNLPLRVHDPQGRDLGGCCAVISECGLGGTLPEAVAVGSVVELRLALPTRPTPLGVWAVVRCQLDFHHGFEFVSLTGGEQLSLRQFCTELAAEEATRGTRE
jgi:hypothetical protein